MAVEHSPLRSQRHTLTLPHTAEQKGTEQFKEQECQYVKSQVHVVEKVGNTVVRERYIQPDLRHWLKHEQLKQVSLEKRRNKRGPGSNSGL